MFRIKGLLALTLIALPFIYRGLTKFWITHLVEVCAHGILQNKAAEIQWPASALQPALSGCKNIPITTLRENMGFFGIRSYRLVPTVCRAIRECLHHEVEDMLEPSRRTNGMFLIGFGSFSLSVVLSWLILHIADMFAGAVAWHRRSRAACSK